MTLCDKGEGGILNFVRSDFKNSVKAILHYDKDALWFDENDVDTMNVSDINCPNENDGTTMSFINDIKEWIPSPWTQDV